MWCFLFFFLVFFSPSALCVFFYLLDQIRVSHSHRRPAIQWTGPAALSSSCWRPTTTTRTCRAASSITRASDSSTRPNSGIDTYIPYTTHTHTSLCAIGIHLVLCGKQKRKKEKKNPNLFRHHHWNKISDKIPKGIERGVCRTSKKKNKRERQLAAAPLFVLLSFLFFLLILSSRIEQRVKKKKKKIKGLLLFFY